MLTYIIIFGFPVVVLLLFGKAVITGIIDYYRTPKPPKHYTLKQSYNYYLNEEYNEHSTPDTTPDEQHEMPQDFIIDKLAAYDSQIESYYNLLEQLNHEYKREKEDIKKARIRTRQADIMLKLSNVQEKAYKLRDKHGIY